jgi:hypothetical protein
VLTINGRGLKTKISIMRKMLQQQPDIMVWTEHHLPREPNPHGGHTSSSKNYRWGLSGIPKT